MTTVKKIFLIACILIGFYNLSIFAQDETEDNFFISLGDKTLFQDRILKFDKDYAARLNNKELYIALKSIDKKIKSAKWLSSWWVEKSCIEEGEYVVKYYDTGKVYYIQNEYWIWNAQSNQFFRCNILDELRFIYDEYNKKEYAAKDVLSIEDCKDIIFVEFVFNQETDFALKKQIKSRIFLIEKEYDGGVPVQITQLPIYYKVKIEEKEYLKCKEILKNNTYWKISDNEIIFLKVSKFGCVCKITKDEIIFGFSNLDVIHP